MAEVGENSIWPSSQIGDDELGVLQSGGPIVIEKDVSLGDLIDALSTLGVEPEEIRLAETGSALGLAVKVTIA